MTRRAAKVEHRLQVVHLGSVFKFRCKCDRWPSGPMLIEDARPQAIREAYRRHLAAVLPEEQP